MELFLFSVFVIFFPSCAAWSIPRIRTCADSFHDIPELENFDIEKFAGAWYVHAKTHYVFGENEWDSVTDVIYTRKNGNLTSVVSGYSPNENCEAVVIDFDEGGAGKYTSGGKMALAILYTDYSTAAMFYCFNLNDDGTCDPGMEQIHIRSRTADPLTQEQTTKLESYLKVFECIHPDDHKPVTQGKCDTVASAELLQSTVTDSSQKPTTDSDIFYYGETPSGDYQTLYDAVSSGDNPVSTNYKFVKSHNTQILYVLSSHQVGSVCSEVSVEKYRKIDDDHFMQWNVPVPKELWFGESGNVLGLFICYERQNAMCKHGRMQALIQHDQPVSFNMLKEYNNILQLMFLNKYEMFVDQHTGLCKVPELIAEIVRSSDKAIYAAQDLKIGHTTGMQIGSCNINDIKIDRSLKLSQLEGLWYEVARPMNVHNQFDSAVVFFQHENNSLHSSYTGATGGKCSPAIGSHTGHVKSSPYDAEMTARLHGPNDVFSSMHFKIVYFDGMYSVHYGCFATTSEGTCLYAEAVIYGRQPKIDKRTLNKILGIFPAMCLSPAYMQRTYHHVDCSDWVVSKKGGQCRVQDIPVQSHVDMDKMVGWWHKIAGSNPLSDGKMTRDGDVLEISIYSMENGTCEHKNTATLSRYDEHVSNGHFIVKTKQSMNTYKVIYTDYQVAVLYLCLNEDVHGNCHQHITAIMSSTPVVDPNVRSVLEAKLKLPCGDLSSLISVKEHCEPYRSCRVNDIKVMENFDKKRIIGKWFHVASTVGGESGVAFWSLDDHKHLRIQYSYVGSNTETCRNPPGRAIMREKTGPGDYLTFSENDNTSAGNFGPLKILHTDYDNVMVFYMCSDVQRDGTCSKSGKIVYVAARTKDLSQEQIAKLDRYISEVCLQQTNGLRMKTHNHDCSGFLDISK